jgi:hypothetical protein
MKRYALCLALVSIGFGSLALTAPAMASSAEVKKACNEQWEAEKKANTIPRGMTHEKYMKQCTSHAAMTAAAAQEAPPAEQNTNTAQPDPAAPAAWPPAPGQ